MKNKVFYQISIILYIFLLLMISIIVAGLYVVIEFFVIRLASAEIYDWLGMIAGLFAILFSGYFVLRFARNKIIMSEDEIFVPEHWGNKNAKIQYETHIPYKSIKNIHVIVSAKNSKGGVMRFGLTKMPYVVFECIDNTQKSINVYYFSKKQTIKIIDEAILRAKSLGNELNIPPGTEQITKLLEREKKK